ncbi:PAS domain S-box protein, partial [bacterium]|nr:PAS domain S-box protein [bacterium]
VYTELDGLPSGFTYDLQQDTVGRMWCIGRGGVSVYDGEEWERIGLEPIEPLFANNYLERDPDGRIWLLKDFIRLYRLEDDVCELVAQHPVPVMDYVKKRGYRIVPDKGGMTHAIAMGSAGLLLYTDRSWREIEAAELGGDRAYDLDISGDTLFVATGSGIKLYRQGKLFDPDPKLRNLLPDRVEAIEITRGTAGEHTVWTASSGGMGRIQGGRYESIELPGPGFVASDVHSILIHSDGHGGVFAGTASSFYHVSEDEARMYGTLNGLPADGAHNVYLDRESNIWFTTPRGVAKIRGLRFQTFDRATLLLEDEVSAVCERKPGHLVFGHNRGVTLYSGKNRTKKLTFDWGDNRSVAVERTMDLEPMGDGRVLIAASNRGLGILQRNHTFTWLKGPPGNRSFTGIRAIVSDGRGGWWIGGDNGLFRYDGRRVRAVTALPSNYIHNLYTMEDGRLLILWFSSEGGAAVWDGDTLVHLQSRPRDIYGYNATEYHGRLFIGTRTGLMEVVNDSIVIPPDIPDIMQERVIYLLFRDDRRRLWVGTDNGVVVWDGKEANVYTATEGLAGLETNRNAGMVDGSGHVWIGTSSGASRYDAAWDHKEQYAAEPVVEPLGIVHAGELVKRTSLRVPQQAGLEVRYRCISFIDEDEVLYRVEYSDARGELINTFETAERSVLFHSLHRGQYVMRVQARDALGRWSDPVVVARLRVVPPFSATGWFRTLILIAVVSLSLFIYRNWTLARQSRELAEEVERQTSLYRASEERYRSIFTSAVPGICRIDRDGTFLEGNPAFVGMLGYETFDTLRGEQTLYTLEQMEKPAWFEQAWSDENRHSVLIETEWTRRDGMQREIRLSGRVTADHTGEPTMPAVVEDITEIKQWEERARESQRLESLGMLAGGVAHDFNNYIGGIKGYLELATLRANENPSLLDNIKRATRAADHAADLARELLEYSGRSDIDPEPLHLSKLVDEMLTLLSVNIPKQVKLRTDYDPRAPVLHADKAGLRRVVMNLITNALDSMRDMPQGVLSVSTQLRELQTDQLQKWLLGGALAPGEYVELLVSDTGKGMDETTRAHIFEPFFSTKGKGRGLGMGGVLGVVRNHEGGIRVDSEPGEGTTISILLPARRKSIRSEDSSTDTRTQSSDSQGTVQTKPVVFFLERDESVRRTFHHLIEQAGFKVVTFATETDATEGLKEMEAPSVALIDAEFSAGVGETVLTQLRDIDPDVPLIITGASRHNLHFADGTPVSYREFLLKPFRMRTLMETLQEVTAG